jgi:hypothetical protein
MILGLMINIIEARWLGPNPCQVELSIDEAFFADVLAQLVRFSMINKDSS